MVAKKAAKPPKETKAKKPPAKKTTKKAPTKRKKKFDMNTHMDKLSTLFKEDFSVSLNIYDQIPHIPTGSLVFDRLLGGQFLEDKGFCPCPGIPRGRITTIRGEPSTGKTTFALQTSAEVCRQGGSVLYIDWEHEVNDLYAYKLGVPDDKSQFRLWRPNTLEEGITAICLLADQGIDLIVLDSVGAGMPRKLYEQSGKDIGKELRMGLVAGTWSKYLPKVKNILANSGTSLLGISQVRATMATNPFAAQSKAQGGKAWEFFAAVRILLKRLKSKKGKVRNPFTRKLEEEIIGTHAMAILEKCKVSDMEKRGLPYYLRWGEGIDNAETMLDMGVNYGVIRKSGSNHTLELPNGDTLTGNGKEKFRANLVEHPEAYEWLYQSCRSWLQSGADGEIVDVTEEEEEEYDLDNMIANLGDDDEDEEEEK